MAPIKIESISNTAEYLLVFPSSLPTQRQPLTDLYHQRLVFPVLEFHIDTYSKYSCAGLILFTMFSDPSISPCILRVCSFFKMLNIIPLYGYTSYLNHSHVERHFCFFQFLTIVNKSAMKILMQVFVFIWLYISISLMQIPSNRITGS